MPDLHTYHHCTRSSLGPISQPLILRRCPGACQCPPHVRSLSVDRPQIDQEHLVSLRGTLGAPSTYAAKSRSVSRRTDSFWPLVQGERRLKFALPSLETANAYGSGCSETIPSLFRKKNEQRCKADRPSGVLTRSPRSVSAKREYGQHCAETYAHSAPADYGTTTQRQVQRKQGRHWRAFRRISTDIICRLQ